MQVYRRGDLCRRDPETLLLIRDGEVVDKRRDIWEYGLA
jgi:hypothetical protein